MVIPPQFQRAYGFSEDRGVVNVDHQKWAVIKTNGWQGYGFLDTAPDLYHEWLVPGSGKEAPKVLPWVRTP